ncbi:hypothetical protein BIZ42_19130 [Stenotrophomonas sp. LM091]|nr:hypothetical protein BIZ42_19130 [Stenotrophomonas sp. LM091]
MTSGGRELLKWIAVLLMTGDHIAKVFYGGDVPVVSELGRIAFPVFALVMAYNLAEPGADIAKSVRRLAMWAAIAQPAHALAFGHWIPLNVLASFALAASVVWAIRAGRWWFVAALQVHCRCWWTTSGRALRWWSLDTRCGVFTFPLQGCACCSL